MRLYDRIEGRAQILNADPGSQDGLEAILDAALSVVGRHAGLELVALGQRGAPTPF